MSRRSIDQLANGDVVDEVYLVADKQIRANKNGGVNLHLELRDKTGVVSARFWNVSEALTRAFESGDFLRVRAKTQLFQGALQLILSHAEMVDPASLDADQFLPKAPSDPTKQMARLRQLLMNLGDPHMRALVECFLMDDAFVAGFLAAPAGIKNHHAYRGGLLDHVVTMLEVADRVCPLYPDLDRDLLLTGIFLHDLGKLEELSYDRGFTYTDEGQLIGHLVQGVEMLGDKVRRAETLLGEPFPRERLLRLKHMIVSHHGAHEFGSPKLPMTPEAIALNAIDNLDAKVHLYTREIRDDMNKESSWTAFHPNLNRRIFKGLPESPNAWESED